MKDSGFRLSGGQDNQSPSFSYHLNIYLNIYLKNYSNDPSTIDITE